MRPDGRRCLETGLPVILRFHSGEAYVEQELLRREIIREANWGSGAAGMIHRKIANLTAISRLRSLLLPALPTTPG